MNNFEVWDKKKLQHKKSEKIKTSAHMQTMLHDVIWNSKKQLFICETFPLSRVHKSSSKVQMNRSGFFNV
jgi:hypothetical protein